MTFTSRLILLSELAAVYPRVEPPKDIQNSNTVVIRGHRKELTRLQRAGQSVLIRPEDETRFDTEAHLKNEANLSVPDTGRINASGFSLPRVRGQDSRFTEVYLNGLRVQDPYVGFPFVDDLDLRAFGEMTVYTGNPPPSLPTVSPNGAISYRMYTPSASKDKIGLAVGLPYGSAYWGIKRQELGSDGHVRIYARQHNTNGRYTYYDDNATPYNSNDDRYSEREHADRSARQFLPTFSWQKDGHQLAGLGLWNDAKTSLPARLNGTISLAREESHNRMGRLAYTYEPDSKLKWVPFSLGVEAARYDDVLKLSDPTSIVSGSTNSSSRHLRSSIGAANLIWQWPDVDVLSDLYLRVEYSDTHVEAKSGSVDSFLVRRVQRIAYSGINLVLSDQLKAEIKGSSTYQADHLASLTRLESKKTFRPKKNNETQGASLGANWQNENISLYSQIAKVKRAPTLLEEFGDGALIRESPSLSPESTLHKEFGFQWRAFELAQLFFPNSELNFRTALFQDDTKDRVILLPSLAQTLRAQNAVRTQIRGVEFGGDVTVSDTTLTLAYARLKPIDRSYSTRDRLIPGVAEHVATGSLSHTLDTTTFRWATRYQSQVWRDSENAIAVPGYAVHDATWDTQWNGLAIGVSIYNVTNQSRLAIKASGTRANKGYTSYSDFAGMPLPGRQWRLNVSASF